MTSPRRVLRSKVILGALLAVGVVSAVLALVQLWWSPFSMVVFGKTLASAAIVGILTGFIAAVDIELTLGKARLLLLALIILAVAAGGLTIAQMWWNVLEWQIFGKVIFTLAILIGLDAFMMAVSEDFGGTRKLKDDKYID